MLNTWLYDIPANSANINSKGPVDSALGTTRKMQKSTNCYLERECSTYGNDDGFLFMIDSNEERCLSNLHKTFVERQRMLQPTDAKPEKM